MEIESQETFKSKLKPDVLNKVRVDSYISFLNYQKIMKMQMEKGLKSPGTVINYCLTEYFKGERNEDYFNRQMDDTVKRLTNVIAKREEKIKQLENAIKNIYGKQMKEMNKE